MLNQLRARLSPPTMSASFYSYVDSPNPNLVCCICRNPFFDPYTTRTCAHTFCLDCIARAIAISPQCPIDRCPLSMHDIAPADPVIRNLVDEILVECVNRSAGCPYTCQRQLLPMHVKDSCGFVELPCPVGQCDRSVLRKDLGSHSHDPSTPSSSTTIEPDAAASERKLGPSHEADGEQSARSNAAPLPDGSKSLATENAVLRLRLSALEGVVNVLHQELQAVQRALGPWYRSGGTEGQGAGAFQADGLRPNSENVVPSMAQERSPRSSSAPIQPISHSISANPDSTAGDDFASYFPPVEEENVYSLQIPRSDSDNITLARPARRDHSAIAQGMQPPTTSNPQRIHPPSYSFPHPPSFPSPYPYASTPTAFSPAAITVPPLDPTVPLPSTLASMHASLVSLAGALGSLASARAQDALYTGEELRGMRAGMHGLRMQLHDVMTAQVIRDPSSSASSVSGTSGNAVDGTVSGIANLGLGVGGGGPPPWTGYGPGPRPFGTGAHPHLPASFTKL
ncbi:uncharacterized protein LAESUDRAFT_65454 [Laetiporus sulphureus 93-53]|uniref:RING-type domain-containing protein n=1 Tax=Laetiporus sulphureus 93-53 TaxID=1314785 RepID=A0A165F4W8_9APHY|nr:uncharacterized protein LAESUDRAFT_65454 [Laetiporus sulphureus 93-53]KZT08395.1 hypothetical protein LAESUDRAFT_65454 [Laetiporus sulphureus 93-53]